MWGCVTDRGCQGHGKRTLSPQDSAGVGLLDAHLVGIKINDGGSADAFYPFKQELPGREEV